MADQIPEPDWAQPTTEYAVQRWIPGEGWVVVSTPFGAAGAARSYAEITRGRFEKKSSTRIVSRECTGWAPA